MCFTCACLSRNNVNIVNIELVTKKEGNKYAKKKRDKYNVCVSKYIIDPICIQ